MGRTGWLSVVVLAGLAVGWALHLSRPSKETALPCPPDEVRWVDAGTARIARCAPELPPNPGPAAQALTVGQKLDLSPASQADLEVLPGVGPSLAKAILRARAEHPFESWEDVDRIPGVGPSKLAVLKANACLSPPGR
jgi:competence protein ComEA